MAPPFNHEEAEVALLLEFELGRVLCTMSRFDEGIPCLKRVVEDAPRKSSETLRLTSCDGLRQLGRWSRERGDLNAAEEYFKLEVFARLEVQEPVHHDCIVAMNNWHQMAQQIGFESLGTNAKELRAQIRQTVDAMAPRIKPNFHMVRALLSLLMDFERHDIVADFQRGRVELCRSHEANHQPNFKWLQAVPLLYADRGDWERAIDMGELAYQVAKKRLGPHRVTLLHGNNLAAFHEGKGNSTQAAQVRVEIAELKRQLTLRTK